MQIIRDQQLIHEAMEALHISEVFATGQLPFYICHYAKGELLSDPVHELQHLIFVWKGTISVYGLMDDARLVPVGAIAPGTMIGDMEFVVGRNILYAEAATEVYGLCLSIRECRAQLENDILFLRYLNHSLANKVYLSSHTRGEDIAISVEDKVLHYITYECPNHTLTGIGDATMKLRCSRRQLQRILAKLCEEGRLRKVGKGSYTLTADAG